MSPEDAWHEALRSRDPRFDGKFFVGVRTTGIYCRPICPARPKRENVEFFPSALAAEKAGYRPCLRCHPEAAPRSPAWIGSPAVVQRALRALHEQDLLATDEESFAARFGMTARHLRRLFKAELGKTPRQIASENRLNLARQLIAETSMPLTQVAFSAGFESVRRFNAAFRERFARSPSQIRRRKLPASAPLVVHLAYRPPYDFAALLGVYARHRVGDLERFGPASMTRIVGRPGHAGEVTVSDDPERSRLRVELKLPEPTLLPQVLSRVRALFDVDSDPVLVANALERSPRLRTCLRRRPGIRLPSGWDPFEVGAQAILGQLVSVARATALVDRLVRELGEDSGLRNADGRAVKFFPSPARVAASDLTFLGTTGGRREALRAFARAVAEGRISLEATQDVEAFTASMLALKGIGPWTAQYVALRALRHTDAWPASDLVLAQRIPELGVGGAEALRPWRGYAAALLWREAAETERKKA